MPDEYAAARQRMVEQQLVSRGIRNPRVLEAMRRIPRHMFVPPDLRLHAYRDTALPIARGQTISQPYIVALMTAAADPAPDERVLEIGTGTGYQAAVLAELAGEVFTVERHLELAEDARQLLEELGYGNVHFRVADGTLGWAEAGPFDVIVVTAGAPALPEDLRAQVEDGGRIIIPVGTRAEQELYRIRFDGEREVREWLASCRFVPLVGEEGWEESES